MPHTNSIGRTSLAFSIAIFSGVTFAANAVQGAGLTDRNVGHSPDESADNNEAVATGRTRTPHMAAPALGFATDLGSASTSSAVLSLHYAATSTWLLGLRYEEQRMGFGSSPIVAGLQYPGINNTQSLAVSLDHHF